MIQNLEKRMIRYRLYRSCLVDCDIYFLCIQSCDIITTNQLYPKTHSKKRDCYDNHVFLCQTSLDNTLLCLLGGQSFDHQIIDTPLLYPPYR